MRESQASGLGPAAGPEVGRRAAGVAPPPRGSRGRIGVKLQCYTVSFFEQLKMSVLAC